MVWSERPLGLLVASLLVPARLVMPARLVIVARLWVAVPLLVAVMGLALAPSSAVAQGRRGVAAGGGLAGASLPDDAWALLALEPGPDEVAAVIRALVAGDAARLGALERRARRSHWAPEVVRVTGATRMNRDFEQRYRQQQDFTEGNVPGRSVLEDRTTRDRDDLYEVRLQVDWRPSRIVYDGDTVAIERLRYQREQAGEQLVREAVTLWFGRRTAQVRWMVLDPAARELHGLELELQVLELTWRLDLLTNGWFAAELRTLGLGAGAHVLWLVDSGGPAP